MNTQAYLLRVPLFHKNAYISNKTDLLILPPINYGFSILLHEPEILIQEQSCFRVLNRKESSSQRVLIKIFLSIVERIFLKKLAFPKPFIISALEQNSLRLFRRIDKFRIS